MLPARRHLSVGAEQAFRGIGGRPAASGLHRDPESLDMAMDHLDAPTNTILMMHAPEVQFGLIRQLEILERLR